MAISQEALDIMHSPGIYFWDEKLMSTAQQEQRDMLHDINALKASDPQRERLFVLFQCLFDRFGSVFPQCGLMVFLRFGSTW